MDEQEWLNCHEPARMLEFLRMFPRGNETSRKYRLFASACCRRIGHLPKYPHCQSAVDAAVHFADGLANELELESAGQAVAKTWATSAGETIRASILVSGGELLYREHGAMTASQVAEAARRAASMRVKKPQRQSEEAAEGHAQAGLLRCIFGNPFRLLTIDSSWLTPTVLGIARSIYEEPALDRLPILGDALEDAGCQEAEILCHCRQPGEHVRGCWLVDLLLGKK